MKHLFKYFGIIALMVFSFYYTEKVAFIMQSKTNIMKEIKKNINSKEIKSVNAVIDDEYIIPGLNGLKVNSQKSYNNMKTVDMYDEELLVYDEITPVISITNNLDKIIKQGNYLKKEISLIIEDPKYISFFANHEIKVNYLLNNNYVDSIYVEYINNDFNNYNRTERFLNKNNYNRNICVLNQNNKDICRMNKKYLIEPTYYVNNSNVVMYIDEIDSGDIILLKDISLDKLHILINAIRFRDLKIVYLSELISENYFKI